MTGRDRRPKRFGSGFILPAAFFLLSIVWTRHAIADSQLATSVVASTGGQATSTNFAIKSTLGQSTPSGSSASTNFQVGAGFWYQDPVAPSAIGDLEIFLANRSVNDIVLEWTHVGDNVAVDHYVIFRGSNPGFAAASGDSIGVTKGTLYRDDGAAKDTITNYFYVVKAADPSRNLAEDSNRVGEFDQNLINGE